MALPIVQPRDPEQVDGEQLKLLALFYFIFAGLTIVLLGGLVLHYFFMHFLMTNPEMSKNQKPGDVSPQQIFSILRWVYLFIAFLMVVGGVCNLLSGWFLLKRKHRIFSMVIAGLNCLQIPFGTALGICTFVVLSRPSVQRRYASSPP